MQGVELPSNLDLSLKPPINADFIRRYCENALENIQGPAPRPVPQMEQQIQTLMDMMEQQRQTQQSMMEKMQAHQDANQAAHRAQQAANQAAHRAYRTLNESFYRFSLEHGNNNSSGWPSPAEFSAVVAWPEVEPVFPGGEAAAAPDEDAAQQDQMHQEQAGTDYGAQFMDQPDYMDQQQPPF